MLQLISCLTLAYLVTDEQFNRYMKDDSIKFIISNIASNFKHHKDTRRAFETVELCLGSTFF